MAYTYQRDAACNAYRGDALCAAAITTGAPPLPATYIFPPAFPPATPFAIRSTARYGVSAADRRDFRCDRASHEQNLRTTHIYDAVISHEYYV